MVIIYFFSKNGGNFFLKKNYLFIYLLLLGFFEKKIMKMWKTHYKKGATSDSFNPYKVWKPKCE
jgi:hypothetical protein